MILCHFCYQNASKQLFLYKYIGCVFSSKNGQKRSKFEISSLNPKTAWKKVSENGLASNFTIWDVWIKPRLGDLAAPWSGPFTMIFSLWLHVERNFELGFLNNGCDIFLSLKNLHKFFVSKQNLNVIHA